MTIADYEQKMTTLLGASRVPRLGAALRASNKTPLSQYFDHTLLKAEATGQQIAKLCDEARKFQMYSVCVPPNRVGLASGYLVNSAVKVCTVVSFPLGYTTQRQASLEAAAAIGEGAGEIDMVIPIGLVKDADYSRVFDYISTVRDAASGHCVKVILETSTLSEEEKIQSGLTAILAGAHMLKTSTGFAAHGATAHDIALLRSIAQEDVGVKASGGIRSYADAQTMISHGADRIGSSSSVAILMAAEEKT